MQERNRKKIKKVKRRKMKDFWLLTFFSQLDQMLKISAADGLLTKFAS
jgi:hypothetical protein